MANLVAYGFYDLQTLFNQRVSTVGTQRIYDAVRGSAAEYSRQVQGIMSVLVEPTDVAQEQIELAGDGTLQPLDEYGNPMPVVSAGYYQVAYPIQGGGTAWGTNRVSRELLTVDEANRNTLDAQRRDADWMSRHALAALLDNTTWTFNDKIGPNGAKGLGNITIQPLANNDSVKYNRRGGSATATDNHYLAQANDISVTDNPFPTIREELQEHPDNSGPLVSYIASDLRADVEGLPTFIEVNDPNLRMGLSSDSLAGTVDPGPGDEVLGYIKGENIWVVEWRSMPSSYIITQARGAGAPLAMRQYPVASLQGFFPEQFSPDGNLQEMRMLRYAGFGARRRVAACVMYIGAANYAIPTGFNTPLDA
jgi:hypothetical protein